MAAWEQQADQLYARAKSAEQRLAAALKAVGSLEETVEDLKSRLRERDESCAKLAELVEQNIDSSRLHRRFQEEIIEEEKNKAQHYSEEAQRLLIAENVNGKEAQRLRDLADTNGEEAQRLRSIVEAYRDAYTKAREQSNTLLESVRSCNAITAGFEAIYKMLVLEVVQKYDAATFESLNPNRRMSVMDEAWLAFIDRDTHEYSPDLTFAYASPPADEIKQDDASRGVEANGGAGHRISIALRYLLAGGLFLV